MKRNIYFLLCSFLVFGFSYHANAEVPPSFAGGHNQNLTVCKNSAPNSINTLLAVIDFDAGQTETWSVSYGASHGTLIAGYVTTSTGSTLTPTGLSYTPDFGYVGTDSFQMMITDGSAFDITTIHVTVNPTPAPITGPSSMCSGVIITLNDVTGGGTWSSSAPAVATATIIGSGVGAVGGVSGGTATISYILSTGCAATTVVTVNPVPSAITGTARVCEGLTTTLSDPDAGGTWSSGSPTVATIDGSGVVTGVSGGFSNITYSFSSGCKTVRTVSVNFTPGAIAGTTVVCAGSSTTLSDPSGGGTWASSDAGVATINLSSGVATGLSAGSATITYTGFDGCTTTRGMTVNTSPAAISGPNNVCVSSTITLSDATPGGIWSCTSPHVTFNTASVTVTGISMGPAIVTYTIGSCMTTAAITVNPITPLTGAGSVCPGGTLVLHDGTSGGLWTSSDPTIATVVTSGAGIGTVTGISSGTATITYTMSTGCSANTDVTINPVPDPITGTISICSGLAASLFDPTGGGTWSSSNPSIASISGSSSTYLGVSAGVATITYTLSTGCRTTRSVTVYPTPAAIAGGTSPFCQGTSITLSDPTGSGVWASGSPAIATINSSTGIVNGLSSGTATITYSLGTCIATKIITVNLAAAPITGPSSVCISSSINLGDATPGGAWSTASTHVTLSPAGLVIGVSVGSATINYTVGSCTATTIITVNPIYPITGTGSICTGATLILSDIVGGGAWSSSNLTVATVAPTGFGAGTVTGVSGGTAVMTYTMPTGCLATTVVTINALPAAITGTAVACSSFTSALADATGGGTWISGSPTIATISAGGVVTGVSAGYSLITYTLSTGCKTTRVFTVNAQPSAIAGSSSVCAGSTIDLSDTLGGGTWLSSNDTVAIITPTSFSAATLNGMSAGTVTITYTHTGGCFVTKTIIVDITPTPIIGPDMMCQGFTATLSDSTGGGIWSSSTGFAAIGSATGLVTAVSPGDATFIYALGSCFTSITIPIHPISPITGSNNVCVGSNIVLIDATGGGDWSSSAITIATISNVLTFGYGEGLVYGVAAGVTTISYTMPSGCVVTMPLTVNALPSGITGNTVFCQGSTTTLSDASAGGTWSNTEVTVATVVANTGVVSGVGGGTSTITYKLPTGCITTKMITVNHLPTGILGDTDLCLGLLTNIHSAESGHWISSDPSIASVDSITGNDYGVSVGSTIFTYTLATGCSFTTHITVRDCHLAVTQVSQGMGDINVIPNPNKGEFVISGTLGAATDQDVQIEITDMLGRRIYTDNTLAAGGRINKQVILPGNIANGSYVMNVRSGGEHTTFHVVVQQ